LEDLQYNVGISLADISTELAVAGRPKDISLVVISTEAYGFQIIQYNPWLAG
jgi:hypothetical protein